MQLLVVDRCLGFRLRSRRRPIARVPKPAVVVPVAPVFLAVSTASPEAAAPKLPAALEMVLSRGMVERAASCTARPPRQPSICCRLETSRQKLRCGHCTWLLPSARRCRGTRLLYQMLPFHQRQAGRHWRIPAIVRPASETQTCYVRTRPPSITITCPVM